MGRLGNLLLGLNVAPRPEVIHGEVVGDPKEPRRERRRLPAEATDRLEHFQKRLGGQVLGVVAVADAQMEVAVDAVEMEEIQLLERVAVTLLRSSDQRPHSRGRGYAAVCIDHASCTIPKQMPATARALTSKRR